MKDTNDPVRTFSIFVALFCSTALCILTLGSVTLRPEPLLALGLGYAFAMLVGAAVLFVPALLHVRGGRS